MRSLVVVTMLTIALSSTAAQAQDFVGARALSLGEAYRATATGNDAIYFNPAGLVLIPRYSPELSYQMDLVKEQHQVDVSVVDSKTSKIGVGLGYTFDGRQFTKRTSLQHTATLALAAPLFERWLAVGAGLKYVNVSDAFLGNYLNALSADVGVLVRIPLIGLSGAAVGYNLIPIQSARAPLSAGFAANLDLGPASALIFGGRPSYGATANAAGLPSTTGLGDPIGPLAGLTVEVDYHVQFATLYGAQSRWSGAVEYLAFESFPVRAGYIWNELDDDQLASVGAGFIVPYFGFDIAYQQSVVRLDHRVFALSLKFFLDPG